MLARGRIFTVVSLTIFIATMPATADVTENAKAIKISGGEHHTLVLTKNKFVWGYGGFKAMADKRCWMRVVGCGQLSLQKQHWV